MTKITFEDLPSTNTPLSANNLNTLQDNVETAIDANTSDITTINSKITPVLYSLTDTPTHSGGTNKIYIHKIGNIVVLNLLIWANSITQNSWTNIGTLPNDILPSTENLIATGSVIYSSNGNMAGSCLVEIDNGKIAIKSNYGASTLTGIRINAVYVL